MTARPADDIEMAAFRRTLAVMTSRPTTFASGVASRPVMPPSGNMDQRVRMLREGEAKVAAARRQRVLDAAVRAYAAGYGEMRPVLRSMLATPACAPWMRSAVQWMRATFARLMAEESKR